MTDKPAEEPKEPASKDTDGQEPEPVSNQNESNHSSQIESADDIDSLLASASEALEVVDHQLGEGVSDIKDSTSKTDPGNIEYADEVNPTSPVASESDSADVDKALVEMEKEISSLSEQVDDQAEEESTDTTKELTGSYSHQENNAEPILEIDSLSPDEENETEAAAPVNDDAPDAAASSQVNNFIAEVFPRDEPSEAEAQAQKEPIETEGELSEDSADETTAADDPIKDILEALPDADVAEAGEVTEVPEFEEMAEGVASEEDVKVEEAGTDSAETPDDETSGEAGIDDVLSAMVEELGGAANETESQEDSSSREITDKDAPEINPEEEQTADKEVDAVLADLEQEIEEVSDGAEQPSKADDTTDEANTSIEEEPAAVEAPAEVESANPEEQIVAEELAAKENQADSKTEETLEEIAESDFNHFPKPVRMLLQALGGVNRPFFFITDSIKDTLGLIGILTLIVSIIAAALILLCS